VNAIELTRELIAIPSVNPMGNPTHQPGTSVYGEHAIANYIGKILSSHKIDHEKIGAPDRPSVLAHFNFQAKKTLLIECHVDTVSVDHMEISPFDPVIKNGQIFGRGSCDTKSSYAAALSALFEIIHEGKSPRYNVLLVGASDEEFGHGGARDLAKHGFQADFAIIGEPTDLNLVHGHKGVTRFEVETTGKSVHASMPERGQNAIYGMAPVILGLEKLAKKISKRKHPILGSPSMNVGMIDGGSTVNTVPGRCRIQVDRRLIPGETGKSSVIEAKKFLKANKISGQVSGPLVDSPPFYLDRDHPFVQELVQVGKKCKPTLKTKKVVAPFATDAAVLSAHVPCVVMGPGSIKLAHTARESAPVDEIEQFSRFLKAFLLGDSV